MKLFLLRHGIAEDAVGGMRDYDRALTPEGRAQLDQIGQALRRLDTRPTVVLTSPLVRAKQTAEIVGRVLAVPIEEAAELQPGCGLNDVLRLLSRTSHEAVMLVGHQPDLAEIAARLINADERGLLLKKAGLIRIELSGRPQAGRGRLSALLTPKLLLLMARPAASHSPQRPTAEQDVEPSTGSPPEMKEPSDANDYGP